MKYSPVSQAEFLEYPQVGTSSCKNASNLYVFVNVPLLKLVNHDLVLFLKIIERKQISQGTPDSAVLLDSTKEKDSNRVLKGFSVLPLSKLIWVENMRAGIIYQVDDAVIYKPPENGSVEAAYIRMLLDKKLRKNKDVELT